MFIVQLRETHLAVNIEAEEFILLCKQTSNVGLMHAEPMDYSFKFELPSVKMSMKVLSEKSLSCIFSFVVRYRKS